MSTRLALTAAVAVLALSAGGGAQTRPAPMSAKADITGPGIKGIVTMREVNMHSGIVADEKYLTGIYGVEVTASIEGLTPGAHGIHLHAIGMCEGPAFASAGGHFDPGPHGATDEDTNHPFHMGDLPNIVANAKGHAMMIAGTTRITLGKSPVSVFDDDGTAIVVHAGPDKGEPGKPNSGASGGRRVACGVIAER